jgi:hypothetical protein
MMLAVVPWGIPSLSDISPGSLAKKISLHHVT